MPEPRRYTYGRVSSPEDLIRGLVRTVSGNDYPILSSPGLGRGMANAMNFHATNSEGFKLPGQDKFMAQMQQDEQQRQFNAQRRRQSQMNLQQMEHDRVKADLASRGLL